MTVHVVKAPAGLGKTSLVLGKIRESRQHERVEIYVPTLGLAEEIQAKLVAQGETAIVIRGRVQELDPGRTMCRKSELASAIARLGYPVFPIICMGPKAPRDRFTVTCCEYFSECAYLKQFESKARVAIFTHAYLPLPRNSHEKARPSLVIVDESFLQSCLVVHEVTRGELDDLAQRDAAAACVVSKLLKAVDERKSILDSLRRDGLTGETLDQLSVELASGATGFNPWTDEELLRRLPDVAPRARFDLLMANLAAEVRTERSVCHGITFDYSKQALRLHYRKPITRFRYAGGEPTVLLIDANADPELLRPWFPKAEFHEIRADRRAYVLQCSSSRGATTAFVPEKNSDATSRDRAKRNLEGLQNLIDGEAHGGQNRVLVIGPQAVTGNAARELPPLLKCPPNGAFAHFNGLRGVDTYKDFDTAIIVGRNQPAINDLEDLARALWYDSETPLAFSSDWTREERPYQLRDPARHMGVEVLVHPDPRIQRLHEQLREGESTQAIDRLRLVHAQAPKRVIVASNIPLSLEIDELVDLRGLLYRTRLDRAWLRLRGVMPLNPQWLSGHFPDLWPTAAAARTDLRAGGESGRFSNSIFIRSLTTLTFDYWVGGQRRQSQALSILPLLQTQTELIRLFDAPVVIRQMFDGLAGGKVFGGLARAQFEPLRASGFGDGAQLVAIAAP